MIDLRRDLSAYLLQAGLQGKLENEIYRRFKYVPKERVLMELDLMWDEKMVQRFTLDPRRTIWRATDKLNV